MDNRGIFRGAYNLAYKDYVPVSVLPANHDFRFSGGIGVLVMSGPPGEAPAEDSTALIIEQSHS
jgi:hypothetical protein